MPLIFAGSELQDFIVTGNVSFSTTSGRFDSTQSRGFLQVSEVDTIRFNLNNSYSNVFIRAQFSLTSTTLHSGNGIFFRSGDTPVIRVNFGSNTFRWDGWNGSSWVTLGSTSIYSFTSSAITYPVFIRCNPGASGNLYLQIGDITQYLVLSYTGNTQYTGTIDNVILGWFNGVSVVGCWSAIIAADENCWDWRMAPLTPNANGAHTAWTGDFNDIDEAGLTEDSIYTGTVGDRESFGVADVPGAYSGYPVKGVVVSSSIRRSTTGPQNARHSLRISGTDYDSALLNPGTLFSGRSSIWTTNPATSNPFTTAEVNALEVGVVAES